MFRNQAVQDFNRARRRAFWRMVHARLTGKSNQLLPYQEVRRRLPFQGQQYIGQQEVPIDHIVGSEGRYRDFDRAFLPIQSDTTERWINIGTARYSDVYLPPVELYKIGDVYFVKDGNHRISVAREHGQLFIDAHVTEIRVPIHLTQDVQLNDLIEQEAALRFLDETGLANSRPAANILLSSPAHYERLREHIRGHQYYLGEAAQQAIEWRQAAESWYDQVYQPLVAHGHEQKVDEAFPELSEADLYLWISEYQWLRGEAFRESRDPSDAATTLLGLYGDPIVRRLVDNLDRAAWIDALILEQEADAFARRSGLQTVRPQARLVVTLPGMYDRLLEQIGVHRWYLGEELGREASQEEAAASWYDRVYMPLVEPMREQEMLTDFEKRTETDLFLWIIDHRVALADLV
jgi:hypothetical protein